MRPGARPAAAPGEAPAGRHRREPVGWVRLLLHGALSDVRGDREFGAQISTTYVDGEFAPPPRFPEGFKWDKRLLQQKLTQIKQTTELRIYKDRRYNEHWYAMFGRLETRLPRQLSTGNNTKSYTNGFGHLSGSPAQLVSPRNGYFRLR